jgi:hypothetical protein
MNVKKVFTIIFVFAFAFSNCKKDKDEDPAKQDCGAGSGYTVEFCDQVGNYVAGYGVPGQDEIHVTCLVGPEGATVSNHANGTYYVSGTYKLTTYDDGEISLVWGGTVNYSYYETYEITKGTGNFEIKVTKTGGGSGNIFLSMASGSSWMFDVALINICN